MRYIIILGDGMADYHKGPLGNNTPLELAKKPTIDFFAQNAIVGKIKTVPEGMKPASDVANLSVMGYDPKKYYTGRSPLEAFSIGVPMEETDIAMRINLVTLSGEQNLEEKTMLDYSCGEIETEDSKILIEDLQKEFGNERFSFYSGISYRHCLIDKKGTLETQFTPPHDISDKVIGKYLPKGKDSGIFVELMKKSIEFLKNHPINIKRIRQGKKPATSIWFWGAGTKPILTAFEEKYNLKGAVISAVDLIKGIAIGAKMKNYTVEGATGNIHTNFQGKAEAVVQAIKDGYDFVYLHMEAPDECGHQGDAKNKILAIEKIDGVVKFVTDNLKTMKEDFCLAVLPDHATPLCMKTHTNDPVPFLVYNSTKENKSGLSFTENEAEKGIFLNDGPSLINLMLQK